MHPAIVVLLCALLAAGCGSSAKSGSQTSTTGKTTGESAPDVIEGTEIGQLPTVPPGTRTPATPAQAGHVDPNYLRAVFDDAQGVWQHELQSGGVQYLPAQLVLFASVVHSGCGVQENTGPFYCPASRGIYLDKQFFDALARQAGVGAFAQAYIVGHEFGHHVQHLLGIDARVAAADKVDPHGERSRSVQVELQADCLSGVWARSFYGRGQVSTSELEEALKAAAIVGDDFQARNAGRPVDPGLFTHGSSAQRQRWFSTGFGSGRPADCDTFAPG